MTMSRDLGIARLWGARKPNHAVDGELAGLIIKGFQRRHLVFSRRGDGYDQVDHELRLKPRGEDAHIGVKACCHFVHQGGHAFEDSLEGSGRKLVPRGYHNLLWHAGSDLLIQKMCHITLTRIKLTRFLALANLFPPRQPGPVARDLPPNKLCDDSLCHRLEVQRTLILGGGLFRFGGSSFEIPGHKNGPPAKLSPAFHRSACWVDLR